jgi:hypothetical protein
MYQVPLYDIGQDKRGVVDTFTHWIYSEYVHTIAMKVSCFVVAVVVVAVVVVAAV